MGWKNKLGNRVRALSRRERIILLLLVGLLAVYGGDQAFSSYFQGRNSLAEAMAGAEERLLRNERLLSREEWIHTEFQKLEDPAAVARDSVLTETAVLRELAELAGQRIHVASLVPRLVEQEGSRVMVIALDCAGPLDSVVEFVNKILNELPSEVNSMTLSPQVGETDNVACRISIRIECCDT